MSDITIGSRTAPPAKDILQTYTGKVLKPLDPWPGDFDILDIAWSLAHQCRYNGHTRLFYSVATHSILVAHFLPAHLQLEGLLHDATEAYISDLPSPIKQKMPEYRKVEDQLAAVIATQYALVYPEHAKVKWSDDYVFQLEAGLVMGGAIGAKFSIESLDRGYVEHEIIEASNRTPASEAERFLSVYRRIQEHRGYALAVARGERYESAN